MKKLQFLICIFSVVTMASPLFLFATDDSVKYNQQARESVKKGEPVIYGKVYVSEKGVVSIITNYESRSRVSYTVEGSFVSEIAAHAGKIIRVQGKIIKESSPWKKTLEVKKILSINDKPAKRLKIQHKPVQQ